MKIKIVTDRHPWMNDAPQPIGKIVEAADDAAKAVAQALIDAGFAEKVKHERS